MKKLILTTLITISTVFLHKIYAQDFTVEYDTSRTTTMGVDGDDVYIYNTLTNISTDSFVYTYKLVNWETVVLPIGWNIIGFCDNINCWPANTWDAGQTRESGYLLVDSTSDLKLQLNIPTTADNGTAFFHFEIKTPGQTKDVFYELTKTPTGITMVPVNDLSVNLYPNPVHGGQFSLYIAPEYKATTIAIHNIMGQQVAAHDVTNEVEHINVNDLPAGMYMVQVADVNNQVIALRKFVKK